MIKNMLKFSVLTLFVEGSGSITFIFISFHRVYNRVDRLLLYSLRQFVVWSEGWQSGVDTLFAIGWKRLHGRRWRRKVIGDNGDQIGTDMWCDVSCVFYCFLICFLWTGVSLLAVWLCLDTFQSCLSVRICVGIDVDFCISFTLVCCQ